MTEPATPTSYDVVAYPSAARSSTHPGNLATIASLNGMCPALPESCRVLELGCGDGGNLIPMALGLPASEFVGFDLAHAAVARGQADVCALGTSNLRLEARDILDIGDDLGSFDYIIAHGIYSWVPPAVRDGILATCGRLLNPDGVAFVSYNAMPGGHIRQMLREMMLFHTRALADPSAKISQARAMLGLLSLAPGQAGDEYRSILESEAGRATSKTDAFLFHDDLSEFNDPVYFTDFMTHAGQYGLQFLAEADLHEMSIDSLPGAAANILREMGRTDILLKEQYLDFLKCRRFRQTLLCRADRELNREIGVERLARFRAASGAHSTGPREGTDTEEFRHPNGSSMWTEDPVARRTLTQLVGSYPASLDFASLAESNGSADGGSSAATPGAETLAEILFRCYQAGVVELRLTEPRAALTPSAYPMASPWVRLRLARNQRATNLFHRNIDIEGDLGKSLVVLLDGTRDRAALLAELRPLLDAEGINDGAAELEAQLNRLATAGVLLA